MPTVVAVVFRRPGKTYDFNPGKLKLDTGDQVIVKTNQGLEMGSVSSVPREISDDKVKRPLKKVMRRANHDDLERLRRNLDKEEDAFKVGLAKTIDHKLEMKIVKVEQLFDGSKMVFYFTAENRVDFRELVKDLASHFKTRIELRQIGVRDKARMIGGLGLCGKDLCCTMFLTDFVPVSIRMAKEQNLPLNPQKISGICGRLMCCLRYEVEAYKDFRKRAPRKGKCVETCEGHKGCVIGMNAVKERIKLRGDDGKFLEVPLADITKVFPDKDVKPKKSKGTKNNKDAKDLADETDVKEALEDDEPLAED